MSGERGAIARADVDGDMPSVWQPASPIAQAIAADASNARTQPECGFNARLPVP